MNKASSNRKTLQCFGIKPIYVQRRRDVSVASGTLANRSAVFAVGGASRYNDAVTKRSIAGCDGAARAAISKPRKRGSFHGLTDGCLFYRIHRITLCIFKARCLEELSI